MGLVWFTFNRFTLILSSLIKWKEIDKNLFLMHIHYSAQQSSSVARITLCKVAELDLRMCHHQEGGDASSQLLEIWRNFPQPQLFFAQMTIFFPELGEYSLIGRVTGQAAGSGPELKCLPPRGEYMETGERREDKQTLRVCC